MSEYIAVKLRNLVRERANGICEYCQIPEDFSPQPFCFEHIHPKVSGGETTAENPAFACQVVMPSKLRERNLKMN